VALAIAVNLSLVSPAEAYIDPGTGTMILQVVGAMVAAALFYMRGIRLWIAGKLGFGRSAEADAKRAVAASAPADESGGD
jgi:hypothetical protein